MSPMSPMSTTRKIAAVIAVALALSACGGKAKATVVSVEGSEYKFVGVPSTVKGGTVTLTLRNTGKEDHMAVIIKLQAGHTVPDAVKAIGETGDEGPTPDWMRGRGGTVTVKPGQSTSVSQNLAAGSYAFFCFVGEEQGKDHYQLGMVAPFTVTAGEAGDLPKTATSVVARDYTFDVPAIKAGRNTIGVRNAGPKQSHVWVLLQWPAGVALDEAKRRVANFVQGKEEEGPEPDEVGGFGILDPGLSGTFEATFTAGRAYTFLCFINDREGGPPHFTKGMAVAFGVS